MLKSLITVMSAVAVLTLTGCASISCPDGNPSCLADLQSRRMGAALMLNSSMQNMYKAPAPMYVAPAYVAPRPVQQRDVWSAVRIDPNRGTQYCNAQGLCLWK